MKELLGGLTMIDWDLCRPGDPIEDLAFASWHWSPLWADPAAGADGHGSIPREARRDAFWVRKNDALPATSVRH